MRRGLALPAAAVLALHCATAAPDPEPKRSSAFSRVEPAPEPEPEPFELGPRLVPGLDRQPRPATLRLLEETRFDLDVQDAELRSLLVGLIRHAPFNAVVSEDVQGRISANLQNVSLYELLEQVVVPRGYGYQVRGSTLTVDRHPIQTRTYSIEYPSYARQGASDLSLYGAMGTSHDLGSSGTNTQDSSTSSLKTVHDQNFWGELETSLRSLVLPDEGGGDAPSPAPGRQVLVASHSGIVLIRAEQDVQDQARALLDEMMRSNQRQVLIDARILEVTLSDDLDLGADLEVAPNVPGSASGAISRLIDPGRRAASLLTNLSPTLSSGGLALGVAGDRLAARLRTLAGQTDVRVVSTPRIATLNNHQALIKVVRNQVFFIAENDVQIVEGVGATVTTEFVPQIVPIGVTLDVTPRIGEEGQITLHIHPSVSEVVSVQPQPSANPAAVGVGSLPVIDLRETDTVVRVADGETIVMGGLIRSRELDQESKAPWLGDLPWIGALFRSTNVEELRTELVILLTPRVIDGLRIAELTATSLDSLDRLDSIRLERRVRTQWWRQPLSRSYGAP